MPDAGAPAAPRPQQKMLRLHVEVFGPDLEIIEAWLKSTRGDPCGVCGAAGEAHTWPCSCSCHNDQANSHGPLDLEKLVAMLLQDVALMVRRPGSWEGHNMGRVLTSHGYPD